MCLSKLLRKNITSKRIELENPGCSAFEENLKGFKKLCMYKQKLSVFYGANSIYIYLSLSPTGKSHKVWIMMMIAAGLIWAEEAEKREKLKVALKI